MWAWADRSYRRDSRAAIETPHGNFTIGTQGVEPLEQAVELLYRYQPLRRQWERDEFWSKVASLIVASSRSQNVQDAIALNLEHLLSPTPVLVCFAVANVEWDGSVETLSDGLIGKLGDDLLGALEAIAPTLVPGGKQIVRRWYEKIKNGYVGDVVVFCWRTYAQGQRAIKDARLSFSNLVDLALMATDDPKRFGLYMLRGSTNRPGVRGVNVDRRAIEERLQSQRSGELAAEVMYLSPNRSGEQYFWDSADPYPLSALLKDDKIRSLAISYLGRRGAIAERLRVGARWFSNGFWADGLEDAALSFGVALDALVGSPSGLPGRALAERFALLEPSAEVRASRSKRFLELYAIRSAVAHGAKHLSVDFDVIRSMANEVTWTAHRMIELDRACSPLTEAKISEAFDALRWGTLGWPNA